MWVPYTVNSPNNGHFGARPTVRYSGASFIGELLLEPDVEWKFLANIDYMDRVNISQGYIREYIQSLVDRELIIIAIIIIFTRCID